MTLKEAVSARLLPVPLRGPFQTPEQALFDSLSRNQTGIHLVVFGHEDGVKSALIQFGDLHGHPFPLDLFLPPSLPGLFVGDVLLEGPLFRAGVDCWLEGELMYLFGLNPIFLNPLMLQFPFLIFLQVDAPLEDGLNLFSAPPEDIRDILQSLYFFFELLFLHFVNPFVTGVYLFLRPGQELQERGRKVFVRKVLVNLVVM